MGECILPPGTHRIARNAPTVQTKPAKIALIATNAFK